MTKRLTLLVVVLATSAACGLFRGNRPSRGEVRLDPPGAGTDQRPLPLGTVRGERDTPCSLGALQGATCRSMQVTCADLPPLGAEIAVSRARGRPKGTIFVHAGAAGTGYFAEREELRRWIDAGFDVVEARWDKDWQITPKNGILTAACRPATLMTHIYETVHGADRDRGYCAVGHSAGGGLIAYGLAHYGRGQILDYAAITSGPPFGRIDYGCAPHTWTGGKLDLCPELRDAPMDLPAGRIDAWDNTWTCGVQNPHADDLARWKADSVVSPGADYSYPNTQVDFYNCATRPNGTAGGAFFYASEVRSDKTMTCFTDCAIEELGDAGWRKIGERVIDQCVPRHRR